MSELNFTVEAGSAIKLKTAGKYCDRDIVVTAEGSAGGDNLTAYLVGDVTKIESNLTATRNYACHRCDAITDVVLPEAITIGDYTFEYCTALKNVYLPNVETLGTYAFGYCSALETIEIPKCKTLNYYAFRSCTALKSLKLPSVTKLGDYVFRGCSALECLDFSGCTSVPTVSSLTFQSFTGTCQILVPASLLDEWKTASRWSTIADQIVAAE